MTKKLRLLFKDNDYLMVVLTFPIILFFILLIKLSNIFIKIRFHQIRSDRIGHFSIMPELFLTRKKFKKNKNYLDIFCFSKLISNNYLKKIWKKKLITLPRSIVFPIVFWMKKFKMKNNLIPRTEFFAKDIDNFLDLSEPSVNFNKNEIDYGFKNLKKMGIMPEDKYVCFTVRDDEYLKKNYPGDNSYHSYRNTSLKNFELVCNYLNSKNIKVIRMGSVAAQELKFRSKDIFDYSFSKFRSDFMDIFLVANCYFYIGGGPGIDALPFLFRKPKLQTNLVPILGTTCEVKKVMTIFKHHYSWSLKKNLSIQEIIKLELDNLHHSKKFEEKNIQLIENSPTEILEATKDLIELIEDEKNFLEKTKNDKQKLFWSIFPLQKKNKENIPLHGQVRGMIAPSFLDSNTYLLN